ncbi:V-type ATP synthase subunit E [Anaerococcus sp.]|uniref:V-type ATP synthase subunit E n=1 Tax=Anaerococcus TaxID=165779 RepID=UPI00258D149A|nr:V-type ATP synthase subunit E [Anaerococcus sp.]MDU2565117.1 V-type ATP synthase subunit E [Anaerococcus sp.]MDU3210824.1 V-type ATP synthase subunit E [Anaerococcus sp.]
MNNLEVILESIINEGNTESQKILDEANAKANEIINEKRNEADKRAREIIESAKKEAETIRKNETVSTERQSRDIEINAKNQVIDKVVDELLENLKNLDSDSYKRYVENTLNKSNIINGEILLSKNHKDALKNENFKDLKVSDDTVEDGFVVKSGKIEYDNRFSSIIKYNIDNIRKQISDEIFK